MFLFSEILRCLLTTNKCKKKTRLRKRSLCKKRLTQNVHQKKTASTKETAGWQPAGRWGASGLDHEVFAFVPQSLAANPKEKCGQTSRRRTRNGGKPFRKSRLDKKIGRLIVYVAWCGFYDVQNMYFCICVCFCMYIFWCYVNMMYDCMIIMFRMYFFHVFSPKQMV